MRYRAPHGSCGECWADADRAGNHPRRCQRNVPPLRVGKSVPRLFKNARVHLSAVRKGRSASRVVSLARRAAAGHGLRKSGMPTLRPSGPESRRFPKLKWMLDGDGCNLPERPAAQGTLISITITYDTGDVVFGLHPHREWHSSGTVGRRRCWTWLCAFLAGEAMVLPFSQGKTHVHVTYAMVLATLWD